MEGRSTDTADRLGTTRLDETGVKGIESVGGIAAGESIAGLLRAGTEAKGAPDSEGAPVGTEKGETLRADKAVKAGADGAALLGVCPDRPLFSPTDGTLTIGVTTVPGRLVDRPATVGVLGLASDKEGAVLGSEAPGIDADTAGTTVWA